MASTATPFFALNRRINSAVVARLADTAAVLNGVAITGFLTSGYDNAFLDGSYGAAGTSPAFTFDGLIDEFYEWFYTPARYHGLILTVTSGTAPGDYKVLQAQPETSGMVTLTLLPQQ